MHWFLIFWPKQDYFFQVFEVFQMSRSAVFTEKLEIREMTKSLPDSYRNCQLCSSPYLDKNREVKKFSTSLMRLIQGQCTFWLWISTCSGLGISGLIFEVKNRGRVLVDILEHDFGKILSVTTKNRRLIKSRGLGEFARSKFNHEEWVPKTFFFPKT